MFSRLQYCNIFTEDCKVAYHHSMPVVRRWSRTGAKPSQKWWEVLFTKICPWLLWIVRILQSNELRPTDIWQRSFAQAPFVPNANISKSYNWLHHFHVDNSDALSCLFIPRSWKHFSIVEKRASHLNILANLEQLSPFGLQPSPWSPDNNLSYKK